MKPRSVICNSEEKAKSKVNEAVSGAQKQERGASKVASAGE